MVVVHFFNIDSYSILCALELITLRKKLLANDKIAASSPTNRLPKHYIKRYNNKNEL